MAHGLLFRRQILTSKVDPRAVSVNVRLRRWPNTITTFAASYSRDKIVTSRDMQTYTYHWQVFLEGGL